MGYLRFQFYNDAGTPELITGADIGTQIKDVSDGTEDVDIYFNQIVAGTDTRVITLNGGNVGIGTTSPATSAKLDIDATDGALLVSRMTTAQRDALEAVNGMIIYNTSTNQFNFYEDSVWVVK